MKTSQVMLKEAYVLIYELLKACGNIQKECIAGI